jgi:hypothetical protein
VRTPGTASTRCAVTIAVVVAAAASLGACGGSSKSSTGAKGPSEVTAEPVSSSGANPFTAAVGQDTAGVKPPAGTAGRSAGGGKYSGGMPGLYGGTRNHHSCNAEQLVSFLEQNPGKGSAWAHTLGIQPAQIRDYVSKLTAVVLRTDTRVTNHGYVDGRATPIQSVLEAGTAVFVDGYGRPVVKCYCGNPLTGPELLSSPTYTGERWTDFDTDHLTFIDPSPTPMDVFRIYDFDTGRLFDRTAGADGHDSAYIGTSPAPSTPAPNTTPQPAPQPNTGTTTDHSNGCCGGQTTTPSCPEAGPDVCGDSSGTSTGQSTHGSGDGAPEP